MNTPFQMPDGMDFMKQMWGSWSESMNLPGVMTPTLDVEEIDRRINDLKTVEHWLNVNLGMLRNTIQALEVQRATLSTLKSFSQQFEQTAQKPSEKTGIGSGNPWWDILQQQFSTLAQVPPASTAKPASPPDTPKTTADVPGSPRTRKAAAKKAKPSDKSSPP